MRKDSDDFFERIRQINRLDAVSDPAMQQETLHARKAPAAPRKLSEHLVGYEPGLVLIAWTVLPLSLALLFVDALWGLLCLYPLLSPLVWVKVGRLQPDAVATTIVMGIVGHLILAVSLYYLIANSDMGNNVYFGFDVAGMLVMLTLLLYSTLGSSFTILLSAEPGSEGQSH